MSSIADQAERLNQTDEDQIRELADISDLEYERVRVDKAKELRTRASILDKLVAKIRAERQDNSVTNGTALDIQPPEPWPEPVKGAEVLSEAAALIGEHMAMAGHYVDICALWAAHTHIFDAFSHTPRLAIQAPDAECGKSLLLNHLIGGLVAKPRPTEIMKAAPFFRVVEKYQPTFLIDECDVFIREDSDLLAAINNGWEPHGNVIRCVGEDFEPRMFSTYTPLAVGGIKLEKVLPATTISRSFVISLDRAASGEIKTPWDKRKHKSRLGVLCRKLARWCQDNRDELHQADPVLPDGALNRKADKWRPLFAIANQAGGIWPSRIGAAYQAEECNSSIRVSSGIELLADLRAIWGDTEDKVATHEVIRRLCELEESRYLEYNFREREPDKRKIQPSQLAKLLDDYKVRPGQMKINGKKERGYELKELKTAWKRYLPPLLPGTPVQVTAGAAYSEWVPGTEKKAVPGSESLQPTAGEGCTGVPGKSTVRPPFEHTHDDSEYF